MQVEDSLRLGVRREIGTVAGGGLAGIGGPARRRRCRLYGGPTAGGRLRRWWSQTVREEPLMLLFT